MVLNTIKRTCTDLSCAQVFVFSQCSVVVVQLFLCSAVTKLHGFGKKLDNFFAWTFFQAQKICTSNESGKLPLCVLVTKTLGSFNVQNDPFMTFV